MAAALSGARLAAAGRGAVRRGGRSDLHRDRRGLHARRADRAAAHARTSRSVASETPRTCTRSIAIWSTQKYLGRRLGLARLRRAAGATEPCAVRMTPAVGRQRCARRWSTRSSAPSAPEQIDGDPRVHRRARAHARTSRRRVARAPPARAGGGAVGARRCCAMRTPRTIPSRSAIGRALRRRAPLDRGADVLAATGHDRRHAAGRAPRRRYADVDEIRIVGLVEATGRSAAGRSIFYPQSLLGAARLAGRSRTACRPRARVSRICCGCRAGASSLSTFTLEDDALVSPSPLLDEVDAARLADRAAGRRPRSAGARLRARSADDRSVVRARRPTTCRGRGWRCGASRTFDERALPRPDRCRAQPAAYAVSQLERYLECPFKYFAAHVLQAAGRARRAGVDDAAGARTVRARSVRGVLRRVAAAGTARSPPTTSREAIALFDEVAERHLAALPEGDRALERTLLLGSAAAAGFGERAFAFEIEDGRPGRRAPARVRARGHVRLRRGRRRAAG